MGRIVEDYWGADVVALLAPHLFAILFAVGMACIASLPSRFHSQKDGNDDGKSQFAISPSQARGHVVLLLLLPGTMHTLTFSSVLMSRTAASDELFDWILAWTIPYLLYWVISSSTKDSSPYTSSQLLSLHNSKVSLLPAHRKSFRGTLLPITMTALTVLAVQENYLLPLCRQVAYQFHGHHLGSSYQWISSILLSLGSSLLLAAVWMNGRVSTLTDQLWFGDYHEDVIQLTISISGLCFGKAFGVPWNLLPLPVLALLGLSVWVSTRMLRYLSIVLFVVHAAGLVLFHYRFAGMDDISIALPIFFSSSSVGLIRFAMLTVSGSILIFLVAGLAVRPPGGVASSFLKRVDVAGILLLVYSILLTLLEVTLLKRPVPSAELSNTDIMFDVQDMAADDQDVVYDHGTALLTTLLVVGVSLTLRKLCVISKSSLIISICMALGKVIAVFMDANEQDGRIRSEVKLEHKAKKLFYRCMGTSLCLILLWIPRVLLKPIHVKTGARYKRSLADAGKRVAQIPKRTTMIMMAYAFVVLPVTIALTLPQVLQPLITSISTHYAGGAYYSRTPPIAELVGTSLAVWGIATLHMFQYVLPDGGAYGGAKKLCALLLLTGLFLAVTAPSIPEWVATRRGDDDTLNHGVTNPYAAISSVGSRLQHKEGKSRTGGWGLLAALVATLLAMTGPLELKERRTSTGGKDKHLLLRLMVFSILFGSGVSWFITIQSMSREDFLIMIVTAISCMVVSFFGTVTGVLAFSLELGNFDEVDQIAKVWVGAFVIFGFLTGTPQFARLGKPAHAFGSGGWLSTYLIVCSLTTLAVAWILRSRPNKNRATRGLGNLACMTSWALAIIVLYGQYGVAGMDYHFDVTTFMGIPASILGTLAVAPILLALEGETSTTGPSSRAGRVSRIAGTNAKAALDTMGITLDRLTPSNRLVPLIGGSILVFAWATLHTILVRGSFLTGAVASTHVEVVSTVFGKNKDTLAVLAEKSISHSQALVTAARLAAGGFWTSSNMFVPLLHLGGFVATLPSIFLIITQMWTQSPVPKSQLTLSVPLNLFPLLLCNKIPSLTSMAVFGLLGGALELLASRSHTRRSQMRL